MTTWTGASQGPDLRVWTLGNFCGSQKGCLVSQIRHVSGGNDFGGTRRRFGIKDEGKEYFFEQCPLNPCLFQLVSSDDRTPRAYVGVHVDDLLVVGPRALSKNHPREPVFYFSGG